MSDTLEPVITLEELLSRQEQMQNAIGKVVNEMHVKLGITASEAVAALTAVSYGVSLKQAMRYWEIPTTEAPETAP